MTPERWQKITEVFEAALERLPDDRSNFLAATCKGDEELRAEVESLLSEHEQAGSFIANPALGSTVMVSNQAIDRSKVGSSFQGELTGQVLGHYQILEKLGQGGMGIVYKARDTHLDRLVAIKVLPSDRVADPDRRRRFVQEAKAASALNHPHIITVHDINQANGVDFIAMEYVPGQTLDQLIPRKGLRVNEVLRYAVQIADALAAAHAAGIVHRDLKPGNIMVSQSDLVKVLDFGLAKLIHKTEIADEEETQTQATATSLTEEGVILGTVAYMSPEQAEGKRVDARSDIFSFGSILYQMSTGQKAFLGDSKLAIMTAILNKEPKPAGEIRSNVPRDLEKIIYRCLRKEPDRRFQHMADVKVGLEELKEELGSSSTRVTAAEGRSLKPTHILAVTGVGILVAAIAIAAAVWFWPGRSNTGRAELLLTARPLTTYPGYEFSPSFSPDGSQVAFAWSKTGREPDAEIYVKQIGVEEPYRLTEHPALDISPAWSPDGRSIAFARYVSTERVAYIVKPQRGGPERTIAEFDVSPFAESDSAVFFRTRSMCDWMPDSRSLIVVGRNAPGEPDALFMVSLETGERRKLTDPNPRFVDTNPAVSPDGRTLVFSRSTQENRGDLYQLNISEEMDLGRQPERLTFASLWSGSAVWIAHQGEILFLSGNVYAALNLCRMAPSTPAKIQPLVFAGDSVGTPSVSRQGNRLAYSVQHVDSNIWRVEVPDGKPAVAANFIASTWDEWGPAYSPDGRKIAFASRRSGSLEIWVCDSDGSHPVQLTSFNGPAANWPRWSPDGQLITFYSEARGNYDIYVIRADGGAPRQVTTDLSTDSNPDWSADGKWIYFSSDRSGQQEIWKVPVGGGEAVQVRQVRSGQAVESPDGKFLYYRKGGPNEYSLWRVPTSGGKETLVVDSLHPEGGQVVVDQGIYFISKPDERGVSSIRFKNFATGSIRTIVPIEGELYSGLSVSPDRHSFLYTHSDESGSDLMLVEDFH